MARREWLCGGGPHPEGRRGQARTRGTARVVCVLLFFSLVTSTEARWTSWRRGAKGRGTSSGTRAESKEKVRENVSWLLEDKADGGWTRVSDDGRVKVWKREVPGSAFVAIKSSATLAATPQALFEVLTPGDIEIVRQYNPLVEDGRDIEVLDRDNKVSWSATMGIWPCKGRDFVTHIRRATLDDGSVAIVNSATTHPEAPVTFRYVRGEILHGVFLIKAGKDKHTSEFTMVHHFNPGGSIPAWLINWLAKGKPSSFVRRLEVVAKKWDVEAGRVKNMPCKGRGFGDRPCAFLMKGSEATDSAGLGKAPPLPIEARGGSAWWPADASDCQRAAMRMLSAMVLASILAYLGWTILTRQKGSDLRGQAGSCAAAARSSKPPPHGSEAPRAVAKKVDEDGDAGGAGGPPVESGGVGNGGPAVANGDSTLSSNGRGPYTGTGGPALTLSGNCEGTAGFVLGVPNGC